jgi:hypothetical protein
LVYVYPTETEITPFLVASLSRKLGVPLLSSPGLPKFAPGESTLLVQALSLADRRHTFVPLTDTLNDLPLGWRFDINLITTE